MLWDPTFKPCLRPLEAFHVPGEGDGRIGMRDPSGLSDVVLTLSPAAVHIMTLMDGGHSCEGILRGFEAAVGQPLRVDTLHEMLEHLESAHFLEGTEFESYYESLLLEYRDRAVRRMPHAESLGITDASGKIFEEMLAEVQPINVAGKVAALIAPHLDYPRGRPCYAAAYATLHGRETPDRVVILGTNHFGRSTSVVATANDFATPLGTTRTDATFLERLEARCGGLRTYELDHLGEHSVELQLAWLQHLWDADAFEMVAVLCPDPCGPTGTAPAGGAGVDLREFAETLGELIADDPGDTLVVAGADLSHVGASFGDDRILDEAYLQSIRERDERALRQVEANDPDRWIECVAEDGNPARVCSAGCIFALSTALPHATATILRYHQAVDQPTQTCVTCTAVAFT